MNDSHNSGFNKLHLSLMNNLYDKNRVQDAFLRKKLSDYYATKLIPDFFYHAPLKSNYYPTMVAARVTITLGFFAVFSCFMYRRNLSKNSENTKKYSFRLFAKRDLELEKDLLMNEKLSKRKIILN